MNPDCGSPLDCAFVGGAPGVQREVVNGAQALVVLGAGGHGVEEEGRADLGLHGDVALRAAGAEPLRLQADVRPALVRGGRECRLAAVIGVCMHAAFGKL